MLKPEEIIQKFNDDLVDAVKATMISKGVDKSSDLVKSIEFKQVNGVFQMLANDYYEYVSTGRRRGARKVPIIDLVNWIKDQGIRPRRGQSLNQLAFAIQTSIFRNGIKGKKYIDAVEDVVGDVAELKLGEGIEKALLEELDKTFR